MSFTRQTFCLVGSLSLLAACSLLTSCTSSHPANLAMPPAGVKLQTLELQSIEETSPYMGTLKSRKSAVLQPRVAGDISKIFVKSGDVVAANAPLLQIDPEKQQASVSSYAAATQSTFADRQSAEQTLHSLQADRIAKEANLKFLKQQVARYTWLSSQGAVSKETVDNYAVQQKSAESELQSVDAKIEAQKAAIAKMDNMVRQTAANTREQQVQLGYYTVTAPFAGMVGDIPWKLGEYVDSNTKLTSVTQNEPLEVYVSIPAEKAAALAKGMEVKLSNNAGDELGRATIFFISPLADETQSVLVKALYPNVGGKLRSNQTVTARVVWRQTEGLMVPTFAVAHISGQDFVYVAEGSGPNVVAKQKPVSLGDIIGNSYVVRSGLTAGEKVVTSGVQNLMDGAPIAPQS